MAFPVTVKWALNRMPLGSIQLAASIAFSCVVRAHPAVLDRLSDHADKTFAFHPTDLPLSFEITPSACRILVKRESFSSEADATISGPMHLLLSLAEGRYDADALFFSRDLSVTGDIEATLALRNALDDCRIDLPKDLSLLTGPARRVVEPVLRLIRTQVMNEESARWS